jgi:hypothetical protein
MRSARRRNRWFHCVVPLVIHPISRRKKHLRYGHGNLAYVSERFLATETIGPQLAYPGPLNMPQWPVVPAPEPCPSTPSSRVWTIGQPIPRVRFVSRSAMVRVQSQKHGGAFRPTTTNSSAAWPPLDIALKKPAPPSVVVPSPPGSQR